MVRKVGPWGGQDGNPFDEGAATKILGFEVWYDDYLNGIRFNYQQDGKNIWTKEYGSKTGGRHEKVQTTNNLTGIRVTVDRKEDSTVIRSLTFVANDGIYGPYGSSEQGNTFEATGTIVGFFGRSQEQINAIGVYIDP